MATVRKRNGKWQAQVRRTEPRRFSRRLQLLREWSGDEANLTVLP